MGKNGADVASYQSKLDPAAMTTTDFIIVKFTQGIDYLNPYADRQYSQSKAAGKFLGAYHYAEGKDAKAEARYFVNALGNPARKQDRVEGGKSIQCYEVVGYTFKALEDVEVPVLPLQSSDPFNTTVAEPKHVKAGETFTCNIMEMASLISRPEYAGKFSGEGDIITLSAKANKTRPTPLPILKRAVGSIKTSS